MPVKNVIRVNNALTKKVGELHATGYGFDFVLLNDQCLVCLQNNQVYPRAATTVKLAGLAYDQLNKRYRYIHTVEADTGERGILLLHTILFEPI